MAPHDVDPVQSFDLPDRLDVDHVVIYPNNDPSEPHFRAVPFVHEGTFDGVDHYQEVAPFTVTQDYREAVAEQADMDIKEIKLEQPPLAHDKI